MAYKAAISNNITEKFTFIVLLEKRLTAHPVQYRCNVCIFFCLLHLISDYFCDIMLNIDKCHDISLYFAIFFVTFCLMNRFVTINTYTISGLTCQF